MNVELLDKTLMWSLLRRSRPKPINHVRPRLGLSRRNCDKVLWIEETFYSTDGHSLRHLETLKKRGVDIQFYVIHK